MNRQPRTEKFSLLLCCLLTAGFLGSSILSYMVSTRVIRQNISSEQLPLTGDNVFSELQKDIIRPIHMSADMAHNTFMRDWLLGGEVDQGEITRYLTSVKRNNNTVTAFLVSEKTGNYYHSDGILKVIQETEPRDRWYFRVRALEQDYETNVDPDLANKDEATVFINYRVLDHNGDFIGAAGVGLTLENVQSKIDHYEKRFNSKVYFIDNEGLITLSSTAAASKGNSIMGSNGIGTLVDQILSGSGVEKRLDYVAQDGSLVQVNARFVPELDWHLVLEKNDSVAVSPFRSILKLNLAVSAIAALIILAIVIPAFRAYQRRLNTAAFTDSLTGLLNRQGMNSVSASSLYASNSEDRDFSVVYFDIDNFKSINDTYGHASGDMVLTTIAGLAASVIRQQDQIARWGGEEFIVLLCDCGLEEACEIAERIRKSIAKYEFQMLDKGVTVSLGVAERSEHESLDQMLYQADTALYAAKESGKNCVVRAPYIPESDIHGGISAVPLLGSAGA